MVFLLTSLGNVINHIKSSEPLFSHLKYQDFLQGPLTIPTRAQQGTLYKNKDAIQGNSEA